MSTNTQITESLGVRAQIRAHPILRFADVIGVHTAAFATVSPALVEVIGASATLSGGGIGVIVEIAKVGDVVTTQATIETNVLDVLAASSAISSRFYTQLSDSIVVTDAVRISSNQFVVDHIRFSSTSTAKADLLTIAQDVFSAKDSSKSIVKVKVVDDLFTNFNVTSRNNYVVQVVDIFAVGDALVASGNYATHISDLLNIADAIIVKGTITTSIREMLDVSDSVNALLPRSLLPDFYEPDLANYVADVWTADARVWAMSRYVGVPVTEFVATSKLAIGAGRDGLYSRDTVAPASWVQTGRVLFDSPVRKRIAYVYTYGQHEDPLDVMVFAERGRDYDAYTYTQPTASPETQSAVRCAVGRALVSNNFMFRIGNSPFDLQYVQVEFAPTKRRIGG